MTLVERLAGELTAPLAPGGIDAARRHLFDALVAATAGARTPEAARLRAAMASRRGEPSLNLAWLGLPTLGLANAAAVLCRLIRTTETDDLQLASCTTPAAVVVPAALAAGVVASEQGAERLLAALAAGYEVVHRLGLALGGPDFLFAGGWPTLAVASAGAAATAAVALDATEEGLADALALGIVASPRARPRPEPARLFALGAAVAAGVEAALAAEAGTRGDLGVLEEIAARGGPGAFDPTILDGQGAARPGLDAASFKRFCSAGQAAGAIMAAGNLASTNGIAAGDIEGVVVEVPPAYAPMIDRPHVEDRITSMLSVQHGVALRLAWPDGLFDCVRSATCREPLVQSTMDRVRVLPAPELSSRYPERWPARVTVVAGGRTATCEDDGPADAGWDDLSSKAARLCAGTGATLDPAALRVAVAGFVELDELLEELVRCAGEPLGAGSTGETLVPAVARGDHRQPDLVRASVHARGER